MSVHCTNGFPTIQNLKYLEYRIEKHDIVSQKEGFIYTLPPPPRPTPSSSTPPPPPTQWFCHLDLQFGNYHMNNKQAVEKKNFLQFLKNMARFITLSKQNFITDLFSSSLRVHGTSNT